MTAEEKNQTVKFFEDLYFLEKQARDLYDSYLKEMTDPNDIAIVTKIKNDEIEHMKYAEQLLNIVKQVQVS